MSMNISFNGSTIYRTGAYSKSEIDLSGGFPLGQTGLVGIFGEADAGAPGSVENIRNNVYTPDQMPDIIAKYKSGAIVDAAQFLFAPAADGAIPSGAQAIYIYKTNASVKASLVLANSYGTVKSLEYGVGGNMTTYKNTLTAEVAPVITGTAITFGDGTALNGMKLGIKVNGSATTTVTLSSTKTDHDDAAKTATEIQTQITAAALPVTFTSSSTHLICTYNVDSTANRDGSGKSIELIDITPGNLAVLGLVVGITNSTVEPAASIVINNMRDQITESDVLGGNVVLEIGCTATDATAATVSVSDTSVTLTITGGASAGSVVYPKSSYLIIKELVSAINLQSKWNAIVSDSIYSSVSTEMLDRVTAVGALSATHRPARIKKDSGEVVEFFSLSNYAELVASTNTYCGLPEAIVETALNGGVVGATLSADITNALAALQKVRVNGVVPLFSRDATEDTLDSLTDSNSTYTIDAIHQAVKTHLSLMATTKKRSERQGYVSYKASFATSKTKSSDLSDARMQLFIQDTKNINASNVIKWFQPWSLACLFAGARSGSPIGTPMTNKYLNCAGIRHSASPMRYAEEDVVIDFDPDSDYDEAIQANITTVKNPTDGGFVVEQDNTTYGRDGNWVYNRANVLYAADVLAYDFRSQLERLYVGVKNTLRAAEVKSTCESILEQYLSQGITVSTTDAPKGFKGLQVRIVGNVIYVDVVVKIVEGIDFILANIKIQRSTQAA